MERRKRIVAASLAAVLLLAACSDGAPEASADGIEAIEEPQPEPEESDAEPPEDEAAPAVEPEPEVAPDPEPDPAEIDITVVPEEITEEYVEAVLVELERLYSEAYRSFEQSDEPTLAGTDSLRSAFSRRQYEARLEQFIELAEDGYPGFKLPAQALPRVHVVQQILQVSDECLYVETELDLSGILDIERPSETAFVQLGPRDGERVEDKNRTPWIIHSLPAGDAEDLRTRQPCDS